jgi:iron(III) transport system substrate-binding protein
MMATIRSGLLAAVTVIGFAGIAVAAEPAPAKITQQLIDAAKKEGKVVYYTSTEVQVAEQLGKKFEAKYGIPVQVERSGSERILQRLGQEYKSNIHAADVVNTSDAAHFVNWKKEGILAPYLPEDVALHFPKETHEPDGMYTAWRGTLSVIAYNTKLVTAAEAPKSHKDLLDPKWQGRMVKAHPGYSGIILTATFQLARDIGWDYFDKLSKQKIMQVQSATEPPKVLAKGERRIMVDGAEYVALMAKEAGEPIEIVYATEGSPMIVSPSAVLKDAPHPNAARLFQNWLHTVEAQQYLNEVGARVYHDQVKEKAGRKPLKDIKVLKEDPQGVSTQVEKIKERYVDLFGT